MHRLCLPAKSGMTGNSISGPVRPGQKQTTLMNSPWIEILACLAAYTAGSIPFGLLIGRFVFGIDIRRKGSGNIGATNVSRTCGAKWGLICLVLDALKGLLPVWLIPIACSSTQAGSPAELIAVLAGTSTIIGHMFPCWLRFHGGKGVATSLGVVVVLAPIGSAAGFCSFVICMAFSRIIALSSLTAAVVFGCSQLIALRPDPFGEQLPLSLFCLAVPALIIIRHTGNIGRLCRGEEPKFRFGNANQNTPSDSRSVESPAHGDADPESQVPS